MSKNLTVNLLATTDRQILQGNEEENTRILEWFNWKFYEAHLVCNKEKQIWMNYNEGGEGEMVYLAPVTRILVVSKIIENSTLAVTQP